MDGRHAALVLHPARSGGDGGRHRLGPVGGRIFAEVIVTLLDRDEGSVRFAGPEWMPRRSLIDLLQTAVPTSAA